MIKVQYVRAQDLEDEDDVADLLYPDNEKKKDRTDDDEYNQIQARYDLLVVRDHLVTDFLPLMHRAVYILIMAGRSGSNGTGNASKRDLLPFVKMNDTLDGTFYVNDLHSINFTSLASIGMYQRTYIRDLPQRFMAKALELTACLLQNKQQSSDDENGNENKNEKKKLRVIELGSSAVPLLHHIDQVSTSCCTESAHSTFFLCTLNNARVMSVDISVNPTSVLEKAMGQDLFSMNSTLVSYQEGGIAFLQRYTDKYQKRRDESYRVGFLMLDAYTSRDAAKKNLEAYEAAKLVLSRKCLILIADTDTTRDNQGRMLIPRAIRDGFIILFHGRMTLLYRGSRADLCPLQPSKEVPRSLTCQ